MNHELLEDRLRSALRIAANEVPLEEVDPVDDDPGRLDRVPAAPLRERGAKPRRRANAAIAVAAAVVTVAVTGYLVTTASHSGSHIATRTSVGPSVDTSAPPTTQTIGCGSPAPQPSARNGLDATLSKTGDQFYIDLTNNSADPVTVSGLSSSLLVVDASGSISSAGETSAVGNLFSLAPAQSRTIHLDLGLGVAACPSTMRDGRLANISPGTYQFVAVFLAGGHFVSSTPLAVSVSADDLAAQPQIVEAPTTGVASRG